MAESNRKAINREEMMNRTMQEILNLSDTKKLLKQEKINSKKHECIGAVVQVLGQYFDIKVSFPNNWDKDFVSLIKNSKFVYNDVFLQKDWYTKDCGVLVTFGEDDNFPVALFPSGNGYKMFEPQTMTWKKLDKESAEKLSLKAFCFYSRLPDRKIGLQDLLRLVVKQVRKHDLFSLIIATVVISTISLFFPIIMKVILDEIIPQSHQTSLFTTGVFLLAFLPAQFLFQFMQMFIRVRMETKTYSSLLTAVWYRVLYCKSRFFRRFTVGDLANRINCVGKIYKTIQENFIEIIFCSLIMIINLVLMIFYNAKIALLSLSIVMIWGILMIPQDKLLMLLHKDIGEINGKLSGYLLQLIKGISKIQVAAAENTAFFQWTTIFAPLAGKERDSYLLQSKMQRSYLLMQCVVIAMIYFVVIQNVSSFSVGKFAAFMTALSAYFAATWIFFEAVMKCLLEMTQYKRVEPIFVEEPETSGGKSSPGVLSGAIDVQHVTFRYSQKDSAVLKDISLSIKPGEFVAFVGTSGCGKSTLMRLLLGFETPESGNIKFDGQDLITLDCKAVRKQFGVVLQQGKILSADIYGNIAAAVADLSMEEAWNAAEAAGIAEDIREMPMGMYTQISDNGGNLSGGQRQRLLIARAIARKPKILFFDEATSALDNKTQALVSQNIERLNATRIVIAHRLTTIKNADKIFVFSKGCIEECGTYEELMKAKGLFYQLAKAQTI